MKPIISRKSLKKTMAECFFEVYGLKKKEAKKLAKYMLNTVEYDMEEAFDEAIEDIMEQYTNGEVDWQ